MYDNAIRRPKVTLALGMLIVLGLAAVIPGMVREVSTDAFVSPDYPARLMREQIKADFGLGDANVLALVAPETIYSPEGIALVKHLSDRIEALPSANGERVVSLATRKFIHGDSGALLVEPLLDLLPTEQSSLDQLRERVESVEHYRGVLTSFDGRAAMIIAEPLTQDHRERLFQEMSRLLEETDLGIHQAFLSGEGVATGYLGTYIDNDAQVMQPLSLIVILTMMYFAFRSWRGVGVAFVVIIATNAGTMGIMVLSGTPYYLITGALPAVLMAVSVADSVYILAAYYRAVGSGATTAAEAAQSAIATVWRPILLTSITTAAGFLSIAASSTMPPMVAFGWLAALGVIIALMSSFTLVPALLASLPLRSSKSIAAHSEKAEARPLAASLGRWLAAHPYLPLLPVAALLGVAVMGTTRLSVDYSLLTNFAEEEPIYRADRTINALFKGTNYIDLRLDSEDYEGLTEPAVVRWAEELQTFANRQPHVGGSFSFVDDLALIRSALGEAAGAELTAASISQYLLLYSAQSGPDGLLDRLDYDYQSGLIRILLNTSQTSKTGPVLDALQQQLETNPPPTGTTAVLSGRVHLDREWMAPLLSSHLRSVAIAMALVLVVSATLFRSLSTGLLILLPILASVMLVYGAMGWLNIWLEPATAMFAAIAIGLGCDFAIHLIARIREAQDRYGDQWHRILPEVYVDTGRSLGWNFCILSVGFGCVMISELPVHDRFGLLIVMALVGAFALTILLIPGLLRLTDHLGNAATTTSAIASEAVRPGDSIP